MALDLGGILGRSTRLQRAGRVLRFTRWEDRPAALQRPRPLARIIVSHG